MSSGQVSGGQPRVCDLLAQPKACQKQHVAAAGLPTLALTLVLCPGCAADLPHGLQKGEAVLTWTAEEYSRRIIEQAIGLRELEKHEQQLKLVVSWDAADCIRLIKQVEPRVLVHLACEDCIDCTSQRRPPDNGV